MTEPAPLPPAPPLPPGEETPRAWIAHGGIFVGLALFLSVCLLLYLRSSSTRVPGSGLVVAGNDQFNGITVQVVGDKLENSKAYTVTLNRDNRYTAHFSLPAGTYLVTLTRDGRTLVEFDAFTLHDGAGSLLDLVKIFRRTAATQPDAFGGLIHP